MAAQEETTYKTRWHAMPTAAVMVELDSSPEGLAPEEARARRERYGPNELQAAARTNLPALIIKQLRSPLIYMLLVAALISALTGNMVDAWVIIAVVVLNTVVGVVQEWRAEQALEALRRLASPRARVLRKDHMEMIPVREVVPGDILVLESGDRVAADARIISYADLHIDESALTGESQPQEKTVDEMPERLTLADRTNMAWMSTAVTGGRGRAVVVGTGMQTVLGEIASQVRESPREDTPLQRRMHHLGTTLGIIAIGLAVLIFVVGLIRGFPIIEMLLFAVAAAVSAIPEGLPAVISVVLALGVQRMATRNAIVRRLPAVEALGSTTVICTDKTGTITRNAMTVTRIWAGDASFEVSGNGFDPTGEISPKEANPALEALLTLGCLANDATLEQTAHGWEVEGDPTEGALLVVAHKGGLAPEEMQERAPRISEIPFSSKYQYMATLHRADGHTSLYVKGAPERVLAFCSTVLIDGQAQPLTDALRQRIQSINEELAGSALRVLAGARREMPADTEEVHHADAEHGLTFLGLWGMYDPPRAEAIRAVEQAHGAGIRTVLITGDHAVTARAIARQVGIMAPDEEVVSGEELAEMSDEELHRRVMHIAVFARVSPSDKLRIVSALQSRGQLVAMTGDGVNDAPALKRANIGIAMGITGTEVAKEAADMVLTDDNFATIVNAVEEGRVIYNNLRKVVFFLITTNLGEIITLTAALLIGLPLPLTVVMILWVNLVTDGVCTTPLGVEPNHANVLHEPPRAPTAGIIDRAMVRRMALLAPVMAIGTLALFWYELRIGGVQHARTVAFTVLVAFQWFHVLNARSHLASLFSIGPLRNRWLIAGILAAIALQVLVVYWPPAQQAFRTVPLSLRDWLDITLVASSIFWLDEILKLFRVHAK